MSEALPPELTDEDVVTMAEIYLDWGEKPGTAHASLIRAAYKQGVDAATAQLSALQDEVERLRADAPPAGVVVSSYRVGNSIDAARVERVMQIEGPDKWAVRLHGRCLNTAGQWEWEPMPSSRDDDFLGRCRFDTAHAAIDQARLAQKGGA